MCLANLISIQIFSLICSYIVSWHGSRIFTLLEPKAPCLASIHEHTKQLLHLTHMPNMHGVYDRAWDLFNRFLLLYTKDLKNLTEHDLVEFIAFLSMIPMVGSFIRTYVSCVCHHLKIHLFNDFLSSFLISLVLNGATSPECQNDVRIPITPAMLQKMLDSAMYVANSPYVVTMIQSILMLDLFGLFHPGGLMWSPHVL